MNSLGGRLFADWNPHFTPPWLSRQVARALEPIPGESIVDPACGAGNLLIAVIQEWMRESDLRDSVDLLGLDTSKRALRACRQSLGELLPSDRYTLFRGDFLRRRPRKWPESVSVVMNPPFQGYGRISKATRLHIGRSLGLVGRFNLSYAFVFQAILTLRPRRLVSILPSNWIYTVDSSFRDALNGLDGVWEWEDVGPAFEGLDVDVGILLWRRRTSASEGSIRLREPRGGPSGEDKHEVRQGVATGRDALFLLLGRRPPGAGCVVEAVRGRDVARGTSSPIWAPLGDTTEIAEVFNSEVAPAIRAELGERSCVAGGRRKLFEFHDPIPAWFIGEPKVLLPEVASGELRIEVDAEGTRFPLHSVIAVRMPSVVAAEALRAHLMEKQQDLLGLAPRLAGGARRVQVPRVRAVVRGWKVPRSMCGGREDHSIGG